MYMVVVVVRLSLEVVAVSAAAAVGESAGGFAAGVVAAGVLSASTGVDVGVKTSTGVLAAASAVGAGDVVDAAGSTALTAPEVPKFDVAVTDDPLLIPTELTTTTEPSAAVTLTSTVVVPVPLEISKKLYVCRVAIVQVLPPSVLTSRLLTAWFALTTCMLNQYCETPSLLCS
jgi:hypothetical protein